MFRSRKALSGLSQWLIDVGLPLGLTIFAVWTWTALTVKGGWSRVYRSFTLMDPPEGRLLWTASVIGWLIVPAIIGGVAGHVIASRISRAKEISTNNLFKKRTLGQRLTPPSRIASLREYHHGSVPQRNFVDRFVRLAHGNDWGTAQDHWEIWVGDLMCTVQFGDLHRHDCLDQAQSTAMAGLLLAGLTGNCPVCIARH